MPVGYFASWQNCYRPTVEQSPQSSYTSYDVSSRVHAQIYILAMQVLGVSQLSDTSNVLCGYWPRFAYVHGPIIFINLLCANMDSSAGG